MNVDEFLNRLEPLAREFEWSLTPEAGVHAERRSNPRLRIRCRPGMDSPIVLDPIGAVCFENTGNLHGPEAWTEAGREPGLNITDAAQIIAASNDQTWRGPTGARSPDGELANLRRRMLETLGLTE